MFTHDPLTADQEDDGGERLGWKTQSEALKEGVTSGAQHTQINNTNDATRVNKKMFNICNHVLAQLA